jgi:hypothetical protein
MQHEPCTLLSDAKVTGDLVAADAVLAVDQHPHGWKPLRERNRAVLEDRTNLDGELFTALLALPNAAGAYIGDGLLLAVRACHAVGPAEARDKHGRYVDVAEIGNRAKQGVGVAVLGSHEKSLPKAA